MVSKYTINVLRLIFEQGGVPAGWKVQHNCRALRVNNKIGGYNLPCLLYCLLSLEGLGPTVVYEQKLNQRDLFGLDQQGKIHVVHHKWRPFLSLQQFIQKLKSDRFVKKRALIIINYQDSKGLHSTLVFPLKGSYIILDSSTGVSANSLNKNIKIWEATIVWIHGRWPLDQSLWFWTQCIQNAKSKDLLKSIIQNTQLPYPKSLSEAELDLSTYAFLEALFRIPAKESAIRRLFNTWCGEADPQNILYTRNIWYFPLNDNNDKILRTLRQWSERSQGESNAKRLKRFFAQLRF